MGKLVIHHHLGLGDHIDCNGMVRYFLDQFEEIDVFAKKHYAPMIAHMFRDEPQLKVVPVEGDEYRFVHDYMKQQPNCHFLRVGHEHYIDQKDKNCWEIFYEQVGIPPTVKDEYFYVEPDPEEEDRVYNKLNPNNEDFIFVHDESSVGKHKLDHRKDLLIVGNDSTENVFHFAKLINEAKEIHLIESCFKSIVEHLPTTGDLFFHDFGGHPLGKTKKEWKVKVPC